MRFEEQSKSACEETPPATVDPQDSKQRATIGNQIKRKLNEQKSNTKSNESAKKTRRRCVLCPTSTESVDQMRTHVLSHFRGHLLSLDSLQTGSCCPECGIRDRDPETLLWHYA